MKENSCSLNVSRLREKKKAGQLQRTKCTIAFCVLSSFWYSMPFLQPLSLRKRFCRRRQTDGICPFNRRLKGTTAPLSCFLYLLSAEGCPFNFANMKNCLHLNSEFVLWTRTVNR